MKALNKATAAAITTKVKADIVKMKSDVKVVDLLLADGVTVAMLTAPEKGKDTAFYDSVKAAVVAGFAVGIQSLLKKETKGLNEKDKESKRYWSMQIGSKIKDMRNSLQKRIDAANAASGGANETTSFAARLKRDLTKYIAQIEKMEATEFNLVDMLKHLKSASALIKG
jgi:gas vesicle protein